MRGTWVVVVAVLGCKSEPKLKWNPQQITSAKIGPFTIQFPQGWRDLRESKDPGLLSLSRRAGQNAHILVRENDTNTDTNIALDWNLQPTVSCAELARGLAAASPQTPVSSVVDVAFGDDRGCAWTQTDGDSQMSMWTRFHGDGFLVIACIRPKRGDAHGDAICAQVVDQIKAL